MKTIGFPISHKENEKRRALTLTDISRVRNRSYLYIEQGYGKVIGFSDEEYTRAGVHVVPREEVLKKDIILDVAIV